MLNLKDLILVIPIRNSGLRGGGPKRQTFFLKISLLF